jgi:peptidyl-Lys metalloendopeptidase
MGHRVWALGLAVMAALAGPATSATITNCSKVQSKVAAASIAGARDLALRAAAAVGDTPTYQLWFGRFSVSHGETVRARLKAIHAGLVADQAGASCLAAWDIDCKDGAYAYVLLDQPNVIYLCPAFFLMPSMEEARRGRGRIEDGTREGTIVHEFSHFPRVAGTRDDCYGRGECRALATTQADQAIGTADSFQYFAEDVTLSLWRAIP